MADGDNAFDMQIKFLVIGDSGVGKTCVLLRYAIDSFSPEFVTTIGIDFKIKNIKLDGKRIKLQIWDTAGNERFRGITTSYFRGTQVVILVYDVTNRNSFISVRNWIAQYRMHGDVNGTVALLGNKCDSDERCVSTKEGQAVATENGILFYEVSAKQDVNVKQAFLDTANICMQRLIHMAPLQVPKQVVISKISIAGSHSWRSERLNGTYCKPTGRQLSSLAWFVPTYVKTDPGGGVSVVLQQYHGVWYIKINNKIVAKTYPEDPSKPKEPPYSSNYKVWYERMGVFLPIYRLRPTIVCTESVTTGNPTTVTPESDIPDHSESTVDCRTLYTAAEISSTDEAIDLTTFMKFHSFPAQIGLTVDLFLRYSVINLALLECEYTRYKAERRHDKLETLFAEKEEIKLVYKRIVSSLSIAAPPPFYNTTSTTIKQQLADALQGLIVDLEAHHDVLCDAGSISVGVLCLKTCGCLQETLKSLLFSDTSITLTQPATTTVPTAPTVPVEEPALVPTSNEVPSAFVCNNQPVYLNSVASTGTKGAHFGHIYEQKVKKYVHIKTTGDVQQEAKIFELLKHNATPGPTGCVKMYDYSPEYIVLQQFGRDIRELFQPYCQCHVIVMTEILYALQALHSRSIMHGAIEPKSILYVHEQGTYRIKLCNLECARIVGQPYPESGTCNTS